MTRYIAQIPLRPYLAHLTSRVSIFDTLWEEAESLAALNIVGLSGKKIPNVESRIADEAKSLYRTWRSEGRPEQLVVRGNEGPSVCDVSRRREPIHITFANWHSTPVDIVEFTKKFGVLAECPHTDAGDFEFELREWRELQETFRTWWRYGLVAKPKPSVQEQEREQAIRRSIERAGLDASRRRTSSTFVEDIGTNLAGSAHLELSASRKGVAVEVVATDLWTYMLVLLVRENPSMLRVCENWEKSAPYCTPYFIAQRKDQKYCSSECSQAIATRRWWSLHGNEWRHKKQQSKKRGRN